MKGKQVMKKPNGIPKHLSNAKGVIDAIYRRHSARDYSTENVSEASIHALLYAAVQAPTAMHQEPWAFAIIQDKKVLDRLSDNAKQMALNEPQIKVTKSSKNILKLARDADFNIFYNAASLIVIYGKPFGDYVAADCWLATQNVLLAAYGANLGSCVIGFAVAALNTSEWKKTLDIPEEMEAYAPVIVGYLAGDTARTSRKPPEVLCWLKPN
jgi:nitroreductase